MGTWKVLATLLVLSYVWTTCPVETLRCSDSGSNNVQTTTEASDYETTTYSWDNTTYSDDDNSTSSEEDDNDDDYDEYEDDEIYIAYDDPSIAHFYPFGYDEDDEVVPEADDACTNTLHLEIYLNYFGNEFDQLYVSITILFTT